jgi:hypothetical protein
VEKKLSFIAFCTVGMTVMLILNLVVTESVVVPNSHEYNTGNQNMITELLYNFESGNGYQPFPNMLNITLTLALGLLGGIFAYSRVVAK